MFIFQLVSVSEDTFVRVWKITADPFNVSLNYYLNIIVSMSGKFSSFFSREQENIKCNYNVGYFLQCVNDMLYSTLRREIRQMVSQKCYYCSE